jgi:hypothetical protein
MQGSYTRHKTQDTPIINYKLQTQKPKAKRKRRQLQLRADKASPPPHTHTHTATAKKPKMSTGPLCNNRFVFVFVIRYGPHPSMSFTAPSP